MIWYILSLCLFFLLALLKTKMAAYLLALLLPTYLLRFSIAGYPTTILEGMILVLVGVFLVKSLALGNFRKIKIPWKWLLLLLLAAATTSIFVSSETRSALGLWKAYFIEPILLFIVLVNLLETPRDRRRLVYSLGLSAIIISLVSLAQYFGFLSSPEPWIKETPKRVTSVFDYPNAVGLFLTPIIGLFLGFLTLRNHKFNHLFSALVIVTGLAALFFSYTRGAALGLAAALVFLAFFSQRKNWVWLALVLFAATLIILPAGRHLVSSVLTVSDVSTDVRVVLWQGTWNLLKAHPILGAGLAGFPALYDQYRLIKHTELVLYPHNIFLNFWVEIGLAGLIAILIILAAYYWTGFRNRARNINPVLSIGLLSAMTALIVYGLVEAPYFKNDLATQFWILCALLVGAKANRLENTVSPETAARLKKSRV
ncbi:MAG: O-antigen ligase family protein [Patescibacteria group bacterium]|nr:O-antigen ligase family protein [Patescibacteria group bacterium]